MSTAMSAGSQVTLMMLEHATQVSVSRQSSDPNDARTCDSSQCQQEVK